jgi:AcrR family transcriptional regulator
MTKVRGARWQGEVSSVEEQHQHKRQIVLREAGRQFSANGFHNTSLDQIAAQLGVTKTSVYHYFKNKNEILLACFDVGFTLTEQALDAAVREGGSGLQQVHRFVLVYSETILAELGACAASLELKSVPASELEAILERKRLFDKRLRAMVAAGIEDGSIAPISPLIAVNWVMAATNNLPRWFQPDRELSAHEVALSYADMAKRMLTSGNQS